MVDAKRKRFLEEKFEELRENVSNPHMRGVIADGARKEAVKYLKEFLKAGFNANRISGLLSYEDRLKHHTLLTKYGAKVTLAKNY